VGTGKGGKERLVGALMGQAYMTQEAIKPRHGRDKRGCVLGHCSQCTVCCISVEPPWDACQPDCCSVFSSLFQHMQRPTLSASGPATGWCKHLAAHVMQTLTVKAPCANLHRFGHQHHCRSRACLAPSCVYLFSLARCLGSAL